ncbi:hypothetical protein EPO56_02145, partial [Patescibacteria group bacterium]
MKLLEIFEEEISNESTNYFILDSGQHQRDVDFESYEWKTSINNRLSVGDLFIYRRPQKMSARKEFMFFGVGKVGTISGNDHVEATIKKPHPFVNPILQSDVADFKWTWKERGNSWEHFWNQYGINQISREDFLNLLEMANEDYDADYDGEAVRADSQIADQDYSVEDSRAFSPSRPWQAAWSRRVKDAYGYQCAVCDLALPIFLVGSHIIPVKDKEHVNKRKDPANGICLCTIHDKAFDEGYFTISDEYKIVLSDQAKIDSVLWGYLERFQGKLVRRPNKFKPDRKS